ncbi:dipeptide/oligopeptide/nickel ABC transporter permease/ATP-binding protein [Arthrobacter sp. TMT4-20]
MSVEQLLNNPGPTAPTRRSPFHRLLRDPQAVVSGSIILLIVLAGLLAPVLAPRDPNTAELGAVFAPLGTPGYLLGGDNSGRDILSRLLYSAQTSIFAGLIGASVAVAVGVTFGLIGGYFGRKASAITEWIFNLIMTFPGVLLLIILYPVTKGDYRVTMLIFGLLLSPNVYRIVKNLVVAVKQELYVDAARVAGLSDARILARHILVVVRGPIIIAGAFLTGAAIGVQAGLAFLGIGSAQVPSFGSMIGDGFIALYRAPLQFLWPSIVLGLLTASLVLFGNALRDALEGVQPKPAPVAQPKTDAQAGPDTRSGSRGSLLVVDDLVIAYPTPSGEMKEVVRGVSLDLNPGETLGLVGESGSGKTQTAFAVLGVLPADAHILRGSIRLDGVELIGMGERDMRALRGRAIAYIPQEPMSNLDPSFTIGSQLVEGIRATAKMTRREAKDTVLGLLARVGIQDPERTFGSYPHQISGGMAQRVLIAGAVASKPKVLIADEPTTALDVTVQAEILDLLRDLQQELGMAVILVTHNFGVVADICDRIAVMRSGEIVERGTVRETFAHPQHDYTKSLLSSILDEQVVRGPLRSKDATL